jgi:nitrile hydratase
MDGVHDLGGMQGFGPVEREANEPPFQRAVGGDGGGHHARRPGRRALQHRRGPARMDLAHYLGSSYFEHRRRRGGIP